MSTSTSAKQAKARDLKHRVLTCLHKLSDRDTHAAAASELESIAKTLSAEALPPFLSSIAATDPSDKSTVRRQCLRLIYVLSEHHGNSLSPYLSKLLSAVVRRLRDPDSAVRAACVSASLSLSSNLSSPFTSVMKPFVEALFTEQDFHAQTGAALCLAAVIEGSGSPDAGSLRRLLPRIEKLAKCESFKAKPAVLALIGSVVGIKGVLSNGGKNVVGNLIGCLMEFLSSEDWAARKAAAEALMKIAIVERESLADYKISCLKTFEAKRFDKVKATRETMNQMIEAWEEIPDLNDEEFSPLPKSEASSKDNASDGRFPPGSRNSVGSTTPQVMKKNLVETPVSWTPFSNGSPASTARKRNSRDANGKKTGTGMFQKLDRKKPSEVKVEIVTPSSCYGMVISKDKDEQVSATNKQDTHSFEKSGIKRALFSENNGKQKHGLFKGGSRVVPCGDTSVVVSNETGDVFRSQRESEDLSLIRKQLAQIESQQSNLMDLLQKFIGSTQNGMHSLEARVHGLELSLDEISFDLAVSTRRMSQNGAVGAMCCIPGTEFLSSKFWGKSGNRSSISRLPVSGRTPSMANKFGDGEGFPMENRRFLQGGRGLIVNPLAKYSSVSQGYPEVSSSGVVNNSAA